MVTDSTCLHVNCGGVDTRSKENSKNVLYEGDGQVEGGAAKYYLKLNSYWGFSSTGDFMNDDDFQNTRYSIQMPSSNMSELYATARVSPISLTYFHYCLANGNYILSLNFAEIEFTNDKTYNSLGRRMFDIYVQVIKPSAENFIVLKFTLKKKNDQLSCFVTGKISLGGL